MFFIFEDKNASYAYGTIKLPCEKIRDIIFLSFFGKINDEKCAISASTKEKSKHNSNISTG